MIMTKVKCCLLVEDDPEDQELFIDALHSITSTVGCYAVANGEEAMFTLLQEGLEPDFIFTDLNMPRMNGLEFLKTVRSIERFKSIPIIVFSSEYSEELIEKVKRLGASAFYSKTRPGILVDILKRYFVEVPKESTIR
jgi:CheY-like chemotaxis protein